MNITIDVFSIIGIIGLIQSVIFISILVRLKEGNRTANLILAGIIFLYAFGIKSGVLFTTKLHHYIPHLTKVQLHLLFLHGPFHYIYVLATTKKDFKFFNKKVFFHFIPFLIMGIYYFFFYIKSGSYKIGLMDRWVTNMVTPQERLTGMIEGGLINIHVWIYLIIVIRMLSQHRKRVKQYYSHIEDVDLSWLSTVIKLAIFGFFVILVVYFVMFIFKLNLAFFLRIVPPMVSVIVFINAYKGIWQARHYIVPVDLGVIDSDVVRSSGESDPARQVLSGNAAESVMANDASVTKEPEPDKKKYEKSGLSDEIIEEYYSELHTLMETKRIYEDPDLTLSTLSEKVGISNHNVSQVINEKLGENFYDFINRYRIKEVKRLLIEEENRNILDIAYDAGFNSKSAFYRAFKKDTDMTPLQYKKKHVTENAKQTA